MYFINNILCFRINLIKSNLIITKNKNNIFKKKIKIQINFLSNKSF